MNKRSKGQEKEAESIGIAVVQMFKKRNEEFVIPSLKAKYKKRMDEIDPTNQGIDMETQELEEITLVKEFLSGIPEELKNWLKKIAEKEWEHCKKMPADYHIIWDRLNKEP